jgi:isoamylase
MRNLLATLLLSQGTPMVLAGDEFGRTQRGNNNAYAQDNEISCVDWEGIGERGRELCDLTRRLLACGRTDRLGNGARRKSGGLVPQEGLRKAGLPE